MRYAVRIAQLVTRVSDELLVEIDELIAEGIVASRSDAVRAGLAAFVDGHRRRAVGQAIVDGYLRLPQQEDELAGLDEATRALVLEEPW